MKDPKIVYFFHVIALYHNVPHRISNGNSVKSTALGM